MSDTPGDYSYEILPDDCTHYDLSFKVIVIGDSGVGKSCLIGSFINKHFVLFYTFGSKGE